MPAFDSNIPYSFMQMMLGTRDFDADQQWKGMNYGIQDRQTAIYEGSERREQDDWKQRRDALAEIEELLKQDPNNGQLTAAYWKLKAGLDTNPWLNKTSEGIKQLPFPAATRFSNPQQGTPQPSGLMPSTPVQSVQPIQPAQPQTPTRRGISLFNVFNNVMKAAGKRNTTFRFMDNDPIG